MLASQLASSAYAMSCVCDPRHLCASTRATPDLKLDAVMEFAYNCQCQIFRMLQHVNVISVFATLFMCGCASALAISQKTPERSPVETRKNAALGQ